jgi:hypothetical protein
MRRWKLLVALVGLAVVVATVLAVVVAPRSQKRGLTEIDFNRVVEGMTLSEVEAILGGPPGEYTENPKQPLIILVWTSDTLSICVGFDSERKVTGKFVYGR